MNDTSNNEKSVSTGTAKVIYFLYLASILIGITAIAGLIMAYVNKDDAPDWLKSHYQFQIRTFWIGAMYLFIGVLLSQFIIGLLVLLFCLLWLIVRCAKGIKYLDQEVAYPDPKGWMF